MKIAAGHVHAGTVRKNPHLSVAKSMPRLARLATGDIGIRLRSAVSSPALAHITREPAPSPFLLRAPMDTARQYRPHQKADLLKTFPSESRAAADLLGDDLRTLTFAFDPCFEKQGTWSPGSGLNSRPPMGGRCGSTLWEVSRG